MKQLVLFLAAFAWAATANATSKCGTLANGYGPFDYTNPVHVSEKLGIVEHYHFNSDVERSKGAGPGYEQSIGGHGKAVNPP